MKRCKTCDQILPLDDFYRHPQTVDGRLSSCKGCRKTYEKARQDMKRATDPDWAEKERARGREKYHRLGYVTAVKRRGTNAPCLPEQKRAYSLCQHVPCPEGHQRHHWSYREEDALDVILLSEADYEWTVKGCERLQTPDPPLRCIADARHRLLRAPCLGRLALVLTFFLHS